MNLTTLLPRVLGAVAGGVVTFIAALLEAHLGVTLSPEEEASLQGVIVTIGLLVYSVVHRVSSKRVNPEDKAVP